MIPDRRERDDRRNYLSHVTQIALIVVGLVVALVVLALAAVPALVGFLMIASSEGVAPSRRERSVMQRHLQRPSPGADRI